MITRTKIPIVSIYGLADSRPALWTARESSTPGVHGSCCFDFGAGYRRTADGTEDIVVSAVTPNTFHFLGVKPLLGRVSTGQDARPGAPPVGVLSYRAGMASFAGDPAILGAHSLWTASR